MATPAGFANKIAFVWKIADNLRGHLKQHEYGTVRLPTLVMFRRLGTGADQGRGDRQGDRAGPKRGTDPMLRCAAGDLPFYKTSPQSLHSMLCASAVPTGHLEGDRRWLQTYTAQGNRPMERVNELFGFRVADVLHDCEATRQESASVQDLSVFGRRQRYLEQPGQLPG